MGASNLAEPGTQVVDAEGVQRALKRIAHEIVEHNDGLEGVVIVGLQRGGVPIAELLCALLKEFESVEVPCGTLDVAMHRDDAALRPVHVHGSTVIPCELDDKIVILVDDVLYTGRTVRAAMDTLTSFGRPQCIELAVLVDRGHRELPIRPDFVGKNLPTSRTETVIASLAGVWIGPGEVVTL